MNYYMLPGGCCHIFLLHGIDKMFRLTYNEENEYPISEAT